MAAKFKNEKYYRKLSKKERRQFKKNCNDKNPEQFSITFQRMMKEVNVINFSAFISYGFHWHLTPEGSDYWFKIATRYS